MKRLNKKGFSLIEILVVVVIIGTLVAIILPNAFRATDQATQTADTATARGYMSAAMTCYMAPVADGGGGGNNWAPCDTIAEVAAFTDPGVVPAGNTCVMNLDPVTGRPTSVTGC